MLQIRHYLIFALVVALVACEADSNDFTPDLGGSGTAGSLARFTIVNNSLLVLESQKILQYEIVASGDLSFVRELNFFASNLETIFPYGDYVLVGSSDQVYFLNFDAQNNLNLLSSYEHITACDPVVAANGVAFSTLRSSNCRFNSNEVLEAIDISNIESPQLIKSYPSEAPYGLTVNENNLFICERGGVAMYDVSNPENILLKGYKAFQNELPLDVIHTSGYLIIRTDKHIYNMSYTASGVLEILAQID